MADSSEWINLRTMARELDLNEATLYRILNSLKELGYVRQHEQDSRYQLTLKIAGISSQVLDNVQLRQIAHPFLKHLTSITNETTHLAILDGFEFIYIDKVDNTQAMRMRSRVGQRGNLYCTAVGKSFLAFSKEDELPKIIDRLDFTPITEHTITDPDQFKKQLSEIREKGYAIDDEENEIGIRCIGAPIFDHTGELAGALSISGWTITMTKERLPKLSKDLLQICREISNELGFSVSS